MSNISNEFSIPRRSFRRAVSDVSPNKDIKWSESAVQLLQSASENEIVDLLNRSSRLAEHAKRAGITAADINLALSLGAQRKPKVKSEQI